MGQHCVPSAQPDLTQKQGLGTSGSKVKCTAPPGGEEAGPDPSVPTPPYIGGKGEAADKTDLGLRRQTGQTESKWVNFK